MILSSISNHLCLSPTEMDPNNLIEELIHSFSVAVISLADDAHMVSQLAAVGVGVAAGANGPNADDELRHHPKTDENIHPNEALGPQGHGMSKRVTDQLRSIDTAVAALEEQMTMLEDVVRKEKSAISQLESTKAATEHQSAIIEKMLQASKTTRQSSDERAGRSITRQSDQKYSSDSNMNARASRNNHNQQQRRQGQRLDLHLDVVTESELNSVCKNIRGRIPLAWINDALKDIESVGRRKYAVMAKYQNTGLAKLSMGNDYKRRIAVSRQHQNYLNRHYDVEVKELEGQYWVSEQDLRDACAFFARESTARAILLILRNLRRIKQVYGRRSMVTYILLPSSEE